MAAHTRTAPCLLRPMLPGTRQNEPARTTGAAVVCATHDPIVIEHADEELRLQASERAKDEDVDRIGLGSQPRGRVSANRAPVDVGS